GPGVFSFFARGCVTSGAFGDLFNASAGAGIGLGSIDGGALSFFATSFDGVTGAAAMFCAAAPVTPSKEVAKNESAPPSIEPSPIPAPALALNKSPKAPEVTQPLAKNEKTPG